MSTYNPVYRATVVYSDSTTGQITVRIPALAGAESTFNISYIGRAAVSGVWSVPDIGNQIVVTADDANFTNVFWIQTDPSSVSIDGVGNVSLTEIGYLDGVTSSIQTQLDSKSPSASPTFTGTVTLPSTTSIGAVSATELGYLDGVTSALQTQLNSKLSTAVTSAVAGTGISVNASTGAVTFTNTGVTSLTGTTNRITVSGSTGGVTLNLPQDIHTGAAPTFANVSVSYLQAGATGLTDAGSVSATNWFRSTGSSGWYNATYTGGIYMQDSTWVRVYGSKNFYCDSELRANRFSGDGTRRYGSYGSVSITGTTNGYSGFDNDSTSSAFMWTNNICGHYYNNNSWNWYFDRGTLRLMGDSNYMLSYVNNNSGLPWHYGPYLQGYNGWSYYSTSAGQWEMGHRHSTGGGQIYAWVRGGLIVGSQPDDSFANTATLAVKGSGSFTSIPNSTNLDGTWQDVGGGNYKLAYNPWSTRKVKRDIGPVGSALDPLKLLDLEVVQFKYKEDHLAETDSIYDKFVCGLIAEDVEQVYPIIVRKDPSTGEPQSINYTLLIPSLLGLVQKLSTKINELEDRLSKLENV